MAPNWVCQHSESAKIFQFLTDRDVHSAQVVVCAFARTESGLRGGGGIGEVAGDGFKEVSCIKGVCLVEALRDVRDAEFVPRVSDRSAWDCSGEGTTGPVCAGGEVLPGIIEDARHVTVLENYAVEETVKMKAPICDGEVAPTWRPSNKQEEQSHKEYPSLCPLKDNLITECEIRNPAGVWPGSFMKC
ncbi:hypothetical protein B9Z19DRAFT_1126898 [Tuber borchii]|uniref:Uncharacterized protein n=1 Tax=Tuber borchii TaxID=42251 RepID=A0A2T6ZS79_TUBBO|nr:hypothetical protein B9Z19DRAFT_1126898 [Tuber borchii]